MSHDMATRLAALGSAALFLSACSADGPTGADAAASDASTGQAPTEEATTEASAADATEEGSSTGAAGDRIPDGKYARVATVVEAEAADLSEEEAAEFLGIDGELPMAFEFDGERWTHWVTNDADVEEIGDLGVLDYDGEGQLVMTSESTGCPGCVTTFDWSLDGDTLVLTANGQDPVGAFILSSTYTREDG